MDHVSHDSLSLRRKYHLYASRNVAAFCVYGFSFGHLLLLMQCKRKENVEPMFRELLQLMRINFEVQDVAFARQRAQEKQEEFLQRFASVEAFCTYFREQWSDKLGKCNIVLDLCS
jgi:hypothetical protein